MPPANDDLANAQLLEGPAGSVDGSTVDATDDTPYDPIVDNLGLTETVWFQVPLPSGFEEGDRMHVQLDAPMGELGWIAFSMAPGFTYPPTDNTEMSSWDSGLAGDPLEKFSISTLPDDLMVYLGVAKNIASGPFTLTWSIGAVGIVIAPFNEAFEPHPDWVRLDDPAVDDWTVTGWTVTRGRNSELELTDTGVATIDLVDKTGSFDPTNPAGPFYGGGLDPNRQAAIRFRNPDTGEYRYLFRGFVANWNIDMDPSARFSRVTLELEDGFALLAATHMSPGTFGELPPPGSEGDIYWSETDGIEQVRKRINDILDQVGWPATWRHIFSGNVSLPVTVYSRGESALTMLRDCADAEFPTVANILCSRRGTVVFRGRYARFDPTAYLADDDDLREGPAGVGGRLRFWTVGGLTEATADPTIARLSSLAFRRGKQDVINSATVVPKLDTAGFGDDEVADLTFSDVTSITAYGWRTVEYDDLLIKQGNTPPGFTAKEEATFMGEYITENFKQPKSRIRVLSFNPLGVHDDLAEALWAFVCGVEIGDVVTVTTSHPGGGGFDEDFFVEGVRYEWSPGQPVDEGVQNLTCEVDVSPTGFYAHNPWGTVPEDPENDEDPDWTPE